jgi:hypothetical protein
MVNRAEIILAAKDQTQSAFAAVSRNFDSISTKATSVSAGVAGLGAVIGSALALSNAKGLIDVLDGLDEMSEKTGVSVEKLSELRYAGETSGTSLEALSSGFTKLSKLMAEAAGGGKDAIATFKTLDVQFKNSDGTLRKQEDVLGDVADRFAGYEDGAGKAALAQQVFGKSGADMIGLLNLGKKGIEELRVEAQQLGAIYGGELAKEAATFNDNLKKLELASQAASISLGGPLIGSLVRLTNQIIEAKKEGSLLNAVLVAIGGGVARTLGVDEIGKAQSRAKDAGAEMERLSNIMVGLDNQLQRDPGNEMAQRRMATTRAKLDEARKQAAAASEELKALANAQDPQQKKEEKKAEEKKSAPPIVPSGGGGAKGKDPEAATKRYLESLDKQLEKTKELSQVEMALTEIQRLRADGGTVSEAQKQSMLQKAAEIDIIKEREKTLKEADRDREEAQRRYMTDQDEARRVIEATFTPMEVYSQKLSELAVLKAQGLLTSEQYSRAIAKEAQAYGEAKAQADATDKHLDEFAKRGAENIQDQLGQGLYNTLDGKFDDIGKSFGNMVKRMVAEAAAAQLSRSLFGELVQGGSGSGVFGTALKGFGSLLGFGSTGYTAAQQSGLDGLIAGLSGARAAGGPVGANGTYLVGERGPELFTPAASGSITPNHELGIGGGVSVSSNYSIQIDARADKGEIYAGVQRMLVQNNRAQDERLKRLKVLPS